jgi:hypothetical protein
MITELKPGSPILDPRQQPAELLKLIGDAEAVDWLVRYNAYAHQLDDLVDGDVEPRVGALTLARMALELYSHPFWVRHGLRLYAVARLCHSNYEDSVHWEKSPVAWQRTEADVIRHCGSDMVRAVADLMAGYPAMREISPILRIIGYEDHHDEHGNPN